MTTRGTDERVLYHYPRRFRWEADRDRDKGRDMAILHVNCRHAGGLIRYSNRRGWYTWGADWCELHRAPFARRGDAKRAVEAAAVNEEMRRAALRGGR